jgi:CheY-like chemotaxis protein
LAYSGREFLQPSFLAVNAIVLDMDQMLRRLIGEDIVLRTNLGRFEGHIKADRGQLEQVLMNLAVNARDAMPKGGSLTLATCALDLTAPKPIGAFKLKPGGWVHVSVTDTGIGMSDAVKGQIFEPFFTTKEVGKGTGLGLATVFGIVKQSGGYIDVESKPGEGARFNIFLPRVIEMAEAIAVDAETEVPRGEETILLIEDDATVRALAREILELNGYRILEARNGDEALKIAAGPVMFQLLLTDVVMPGQSGRELADQLMAQRNDLRVLFMSGYTDDAIVHHGVLEDGLDFIQKPFSPDALARRVRVVLDR